jgi:uncharacterized membrane protein YfcA
VGAWISTQVSTRTLMVIYEVVLATLVILFVKRHGGATPGKRAHFGIWRHPCFLFSGMLSGCMAAGSSVMIVPLFKNKGVRFEVSTTTASALNVVIAVVVLVAYVVLGQRFNMMMPVHSFGFLCWPAVVAMVCVSVVGVPFGARVAQGLSETRMVRRYMIALTLVFYIVLAKLIYLVL